MLVTLRKYQPVWEKVKADGRCDIAVHRVYHKRVKKAVIKEKDMDLAYKLHCSELSPPVVAVLRAQSVGSVIKFSLEIKPLITVDTI